MTKARDLANIISSGFTADDIPNLAASKITSGTFDNARLPSDLTLGGTTTGTFSGNLTGNVTGTASQATTVYVDESEDDNVNYNIVFENTAPSGNGFSQMQVDNQGLVFNPYVNMLITQRISSTVEQRIGSSGSDKWKIVYDSGDNDLVFQYNGTTVFKIASNGAITSADNVTAFGSP